MKRVHAAVAVLCIAVAAVSSGQSSSPGPLGVTVHPPVMNVDAKNTASGTIILSNNSEKPVELLLTVEDFYSDPAEPVGAKVKFGPVGATPPDKPEFGPVALAPHASARVRIEAADLVEAGLLTARLMNHGQEIAKLEALRKDFPFNVTPAGWKADAPLTLRVQRNQSPWVVLKNDDSMTYSIDATLSAVGLGSPIKVRVPEVRGGETRFVQFDESRWVPEKLALDGLLRDIETDGMLTLVATPRDPTLKLRWKEKNFPVKLARSFWSRFERSLILPFVLGVILVAGGLASLLLTYWVPNRLRRVNVREIVESVSPTIRSLSPAIASSLRVGVRVERQRLLQRLRSRSVLSPDFRSLANDCEAAAKRLIRAVETLRAVDRLMRRIERNWPSAGVHGPTLLRQGCMMLSDAQNDLDQAELTEDVVAEVETLVVKAEATIESSQTLEQPVVDSVAARVKRLMDLMTASGALATSQTVVKTLANIPVLSQALTDKDLADAQKLLSGKYIAADIAATKLDLVAAFAEAHQMATADGKGAQADAYLTRFVSALQRPSFAAFREAEVLTGLMQELVFADDVVEEIRKGRLEIGYEPQSPRVNQSVSLSVSFTKRNLNTAAARKAVTCEWTFRHRLEPAEKSKTRRFFEFFTTPFGDEAPRLDWKETGFNVSHYFPEPGPQCVRVRFIDDQGNAIAGATGKAVELTTTILVDGQRRRPFGERTKVEMTRLVVILGATILGLLAGAQEQLARLDLVPGIIAVFLLGFSADQVKNLLGPPPET